MPFGETITIPNLEDYITIVDNVDTAGQYTTTANRTTLADATRYVWRTNTETATTAMGTINITNDHEEIYDRIIALEQAVNPEKVQELLMQVEVLERRIKELEKLTHWYELMIGGEAQ